MAQPHTQPLARTHSHTHTWLNVAASSTPLVTSVLWCQRQGQPGSTCKMCTTQATSQTAATLQTAQVHRLLYAHARCTHGCCEDHGRIGGEKGLRRASMQILPQAHHFVDGCGSAFRPSTFLAKASSSFVRVSSSASRRSIIASSSRAATSATSA